MPRLGSRVRIPSPAPVFPGLSANCGPCLGLRDREVSAGPWCPRAAISFMPEAVRLTGVCHHHHTCDHIIPSAKSRAGGQLDGALWLRRLRPVQTQSSIKRPIIGGKRSRSGPFRPAAPEILGRPPGGRRIADESVSEFSAIKPRRLTACQRARGQRRRLPQHARKPLRRRWCHLLGLPSAPRLFSHSGKIGHAIGESG